MKGDLAGFRTLSDKYSIAVTEHGFDMGSITLSGVRQKYSRDTYIQIRLIRKKYDKSCNK